MNNFNCTTLDMVLGERVARDDMGRTRDDGEMVTKRKVSWGYQGTGLDHHLLSPQSNSKIVINGVAQVSVKIPNKLFVFVIY